MAKEITYNKLVRDKIPEIIDNEGKKYQVHVADNQEYRESLVKKLQEELDEFNCNPSEEEAADILEVINCLFAHHGLNLTNIEAVRNKKLFERGGFIKRFILEKVIE